jgi:hypothetical protein
MHVKSIIFFCLVSLVFLMLSCSKDKDKITNPFNFTNETEYINWLNTHEWGVGAYVYVIDGRSDTLGLDVVIENYRNYEGVDFNANFSLTINNLDCPVYSDSTSEDMIYTRDLDIPYASSLHYVFKINNSIKIDKTISIPSMPLLTGPSSIDFTQDNIFSWTLDHDSQLQFFYGYVSNYFDEQYINQVLPTNARSYTLPANTFTLLDSDNQFYIEEANMAEFNNNIAFVSKLDYYEHYKKIPRPHGFLSK